MFDEEFCVTDDFLSDSQGLQWRFKVMGLIHLILLPLMLLFMSLSFFLQNAQHFHTDKNYLGPREWSPLARWRFREFNELPHVFDQRINKSYSAVNLYLSGFKNLYFDKVARCVGYISGALVASLLVVGFLSEDMLLFVSIAEHNLLWYLGLLTALYAFSRSYTIDETKQGNNPKILMDEFCSHTHHYPVHWGENPSADKVRNEITELFQFKMQIFIIEIMSVFLTPLVLIFSLPSCVPEVLEFIRQHFYLFDILEIIIIFSIGIIQKKLMILDRFVIIGDFVYQ
jgi:autophagy-related protein 9